MLALKVTSTPVSFSFLASLVQTSCVSSAAVLEERKGSRRECRSDWNDFLWIPSVDSTHFIFLHLLT